MTINMKLKTIAAGSLICGGIRETPGVSFMINAF